MLKCNKRIGKKMREFKINKNDAGQRLDKFIQKTVKGIPLSLMYKAIRLKKIKVNRKRAEQKQMLLEGDVVQMFLSEDFFSDKISSNELFTIKPEVNVAYEDEKILIANKPTGALVHSGDGDGKVSGDGNTGDRNTLIYHIQAYLAQRGEYKPDEENSFAPALCNRIDRNTCGLVISAKDAETLRAINERIRENNITKKYLCAVHGVPPVKCDTLVAYHIKDSRSNLVRIYDKEVKGAKEIITKYTVIDYNKKLNVSLLEIELVTGRTHQIRAHLSWIGYPLLGDGKYGQIDRDKKLGYKHQALCAYKLYFKSVDDQLSYLNGKTISVDKETVYFLKEFREDSYSRLFVK